MPPAIRVENLSKSYRIGQASQRAPYRTLRESLAEAARSAWRWRPGNDGASEEFWALKGVDFEVQPGEVVGIIGRNGAGKSTLLKILSRITEPTDGRVELRGRIASLLEVGTGFHPELTGRENIYLNGSILGMSRREIGSKFDEIVDFSEIEEFLDTPVKRYSSGMYVRLAFAVASHLEPDILIIDEVLAVGDAAFQKKCLGKMENVAQLGRTVLLVSHSMPMVSRLCTRGVLMESGKVVTEDEAPAVIRRYMSSGLTGESERTWKSPADAPGDGCARLKTVRILDHNREVAADIEIDRDCYIQIEYWNLAARPRKVAAFHLINEAGVVVFASIDCASPDWEAFQAEAGVVRSTCRIPGNLLAEGGFSILGAVVSYNPSTVHALERDAVSFRVVDRTEGTGARGLYAGGDFPGVVRPLLDWTVEGLPC